MPLEPIILAAAAIGTAVGYFVKSFRVRGDHIDTFNGEKQAILEALEDFKVTVANHGLRIASLESKSRLYKQKETGA